MKENINIDFNLINNNKLIYLLGAYSLVLILLYCISYKFQKDFSNINKPSKILVFILFTYLSIFSSIAFLTFSNILSLNNKLDVFESKKLGFDNHVKEKSEIFLGLLNNTMVENNMNINSFYTNEGSNETVIIISIVNFIIYFILPLICFYLIEEKNYNENNMNHSENQLMNNIDEAEYLQIEPGINSVNYSHTEMDYMQIIKNFSFYLTAYFSLNIIYIILFKTLTLNSTNVLELYTYIPESIRKYSSLKSDYEILTFINFGIIFILSKIFLLIYLPYGLGKVCSLLIDNLKNTQELKFEYNNLNSGFSKNYEMIKQITTQKLMTGKNLSKKEKILLRQCKENQTLLEHKQEILEEKYSKIKVVLFHLLFPVKFLLIIMILLINFLILFSKLSAIYSNFFQSECGVYCGFYSDKILSSIGLEDIFEYIISSNETFFQINNKIFVGILIGLLYIYLLVCLLYSMKYLGIFNLVKLSFSENIKNRFTWIKCEYLKSDKILTTSFYTLFFILAITGIHEILNMTPKISNFMENYNKCDMHLIDKKDCKFSYFMLFNLKNSVNFSFEMIIILFLDSLIIILSFIFVLYLPIKSVIRFTYDQKSNNEDDE